MNPSFTQTQIKNLSMPELVELLGTNSQIGLSSQAAKVKAVSLGFNEIPVKHKNLILLFIKKFWSLSAWMLEAIALLSFILKKWTDFYVVIFLLLLNAMISFLQERRAQKVVQMLQSKLQMQTRVLRDGIWCDLSARELVPGDIIRLRMGDLVPADLRIIDGTAQVDQSTLTGESKDVTKNVGDEVFSASIVRLGEFLGVVVFTGIKTFYGRTVELVQSAQPKLHMEEVVSKLVRTLFLIVGAIVAVLLVVGIFRGTPVVEILPLCLVLLMAAVPIALPVMFTVSTAIGARDLGKKGVLITRLSATEDAATMQVLFVDKTGTITLNQLAVKEFAPENGVSSDDLLLYAALSSNESNRDSIDSAILKAAHEKKLLLENYKQTEFVPFSPATRKTSATISDSTGIFIVTKGALHAIANLSNLTTEKIKQLEVTVDAFAEKGYRCLGIAKTIGNQTNFLGLIALYDPPRPDSKDLITKLHKLGVQIKMLTGDALPVARQVASEVGLNKIIKMPEPQSILEYLKQNDGIAEVFPEDKYKVIKAFQDEKIIVGMTGDGVNDSPALQAAEVGIAVYGATDAARASASVVLTDSGLSGIVDLVVNGRSVYQRILTWIINKVSRTVLKTGFVGISYLITGQLVISALGMIVLVFMTDFVKIALATDKVRPSQHPDSWDIGYFTTISMILGICMVAESLALLWMGCEFFGIELASRELHTYSFLILLFMALFSIVSIRERDSFWKSRPSETLMLALFSSGSLGILLGLKGLGDLPAISIYAVVAVLGGALVFSLGFNDFIKRGLYLRLAPRKL
jgi:H+-transporting ATPase